MRCDLSSSEISNQLKGTTQTGKAGIVSHDGHQEIQDPAPRRVKRYASHPRTKL